MGRHYRNTNVMNFRMRSPRTRKTEGLSYKHDSISAMLRCAKRRIARLILFVWQRRNTHKPRKVPFYVQSIKRTSR